MKVNATETYKLPAMVFALIAACLIVYGRVAGYDFINFDDNLYVYENQWVRNGYSWSAVAWSFSTIDYFYWQPVTWLSHMLDCELFGLRPGWHHFTNLLFHIVNSVLAFAIFRRLTGAFWRSAALAAIFALHPLRIESVAWVAERKDVLSAFWFLLMLWCYIRHARQPSRSRYLAVLAALALGLMSKPMVATAPLLLLLLDFWPLRRVALAEKAPML